MSKSEQDPLRIQQVRKARAMAYFAIAETQVISDLADLPPWFLFNAIVCSEWTDEGLLNFVFYIFLRPPLSANQSFEERDGVKTLIEIDPESGGKTTVMLHGAFEQGRVDLFELEIDTVKNRVVIKRSTDLTTIHAEDLFLPITGDAASVTNLNEKCLTLIGGTLPTVTRAQ